LVSAQATGAALIAHPTPKANANAPTRPTKSIGITPVDERRGVTAPARFRTNKELTDDDCII
jgi:hypothetical protein